MTLGPACSGRSCALAWKALLLAACLAAVTFGQEAGKQVAFRSAKEKSKLREGSRLVDRAGKVSNRLERFIFTPEGETDSFTILENQTLERVNSAASNQDADQHWTVTGLVTEYNGAKFLLLERAVIKPVKRGRAAGE